MEYVLYVSVLEESNLVQATVFGYTEVFVPTIPLTQKAAKLSAAKLQSSKTAMTYKSHKRSNCIFRTGSFPKVVPYFRRPVSC